MKTRPRAAGRIVRRLGVFIGGESTTKNESETAHGLP
jgi:hypothetical protein